MNIPLQLIVFSLPTLIYMAFRRLRGVPWRELWRNIGWQGAGLSHFLWAVFVALALGLFAGPALFFIPQTILEDPNVNVSAYAGLTPGVGTFLIIFLREAFYVALGEEIFFRGLLGGWLMRRFGFLAGNTIQAFLFLLPHLLLLLVSVALWPLLIVQLLAGWLLGWLRHRSGSILPGWLAHTLTNAGGALVAMA